MPIAFTCPHCGKRTDVANAFAGRTGPCSACGEMITVPAFTSDPVKTVAAPSPKSSNSWLVSVVIVVASVAPLIICGGLLVALLLPALLVSRGNSRGCHCNNNLKNIALGLQNYHDTYKSFPAGAMHAGTAGSAERLGPSWWVGILPFCEQRNFYDKMVVLQQPGAPGNGAFNAQNINAHIPGAPLRLLAPEYMRCPSSPLPVMEMNKGPVVLPTYVGISGGCDITANSPDYQSGVGAVGLVPPNTTGEYMNLRKGLGHTPGGIVTVSGMLPPCEYVNMADCTDGTSNTMIVAEQSDWLRDADPSVEAMYHGDPGWDTSGTGPPNASLIAGGGFISGTVQSTRVPQANAGLPGSPPAAYDCYNITTVRYRPDFKKVMGVSAHPGCSEDHGINNPLQSPHPGGLLVAFVDGSVHFISGTTDLSVQLRIAIRDDGQNVKLD